MPRMEAHAALLFDQFGDAPGGPQLRRVPERGRAPLEGPLDPPQVGRREARLAPRPAGVLQPGQAVRGQLLRPPAHRLAVHTHAPCDLGLRHATAQELRGFPPPPLQGLEVPFPANWMSHAHQDNMRRPFRHYIIRCSITPAIPC